jgi:hypothetical protein
MICGGSLVADPCLGQFAQLLQLLEIRSAEQGSKLAIETLPLIVWRPCSQCDDQHAASSTTQLT